MAMELEFWLPDGPNGEVLDFAVRTSAGTMIPQFLRYLRKDDHAYVMVTHVSRQRGSWIVWVRPGYDSGTHPAVGRIETIEP